MPDDLYSDSPEAEATASNAETGGSPTSILPKDFFQGKDLQPGGRCEVEIQRVHDDSVEVSYVPEAEHEVATTEEAPPVDPGMAPLME